MEHMSVIVRNTFIEIERPADPSSARRASSLPHEWRVRDSLILISASTRLAITTNADDEAEVMQINLQSAANSSASTAPAVIATQSSGKAHKPAVPQVPASLLQMSRNNCAVRLNALDLFVPEMRKSGRARVSATQVSPKDLVVRSRSNLKSRSRSASSDRSGCSCNSLGTGSTGSGSDMSNGVSSGSSVSATVSPSNVGRAGVVIPMPSPDKTAAMPEEIDHVSGSRRSRRRRAAARKAAKEGQLRVHAPLFQPVGASISQETGALSNEMFDMISGAQASVLSCPHVLSVQIVKPDSQQTGATTIMVSFHPGKVWAHDVRTLMKNAFLEAAEKSEQVFILGYGAAPFSDESDVGFTATIASVPVDHQHAICWDFWQKGFCQRLSTCRWCHPVSSDLMDVKFVVEPAQLPQLQVQPFLVVPACQVDSWCAPASCWMGCSA